MATDSATLDRRSPKARRAPPPDAPDIASPAAPIARGMGLDQPFFDDKNRAFWILQSIGWSGYFFLRSLSGFAGDGLDVARPHASAYRNRIFAHPVDGIAVPPADQNAAAVDADPVARRGDPLFSAFSVIETWSVATFLKPNPSRRGSRS